MAPINSHLIKAHLLTVVCLTGTVESSKILLDCKESAATLINFKTGVGLRVPFISTVGRYPLVAITSRPTLIIHIDNRRKYLKK